MAQGRDRISFEDETAVGNALGDAMAEAAWLGVFSGGKQIVRTQKYQDNERKATVLNIQFSDGSAVNIVGTFEVRFKEPGSTKKSQDELVEHGKQIMAGEVVDEQWSDE